MSDLRNLHLERLRILQQFATQGPVQWVNPETDEPLDPYRAGPGQGVHELSLRTVAKYPTKYVGPLPVFVLTHVEEPEETYINGKWVTPDLALIVEMWNAFPALLDIAEAGLAVLERQGHSELQALREALSAIPKEEQ